MVTTEARLTGTHVNHDLAFTVLFGGVDLAYTTTSDTAGIVTALAGIGTTTWTQVKTGLHIVGSTTQSINIFQPTISPSQLELRITDADNTLTDYLFNKHGTVTDCYLRETLDMSNNTCKTSNNGSFTANGTIYIGTEAIGYTNRYTDTSTPFRASYFTGLTRGKWSLYRNALGDDIGMRHDLETFGEAYEGVAPRVTDKPLTWLNRDVIILVHHKEKDGDGVETWSTAALPWEDGNAKAVWAGRIKGWTDNSDGTLSLKCMSIHERLMRSIFTKQFKADALAWAAEYGQLEIRDHMSSIWLAGGYSSGVGSTSYGLHGQLDHAGWTEGFYSSIEIVSFINDQITDWASAGTPDIKNNDAWSIGIEQTDDGWRVVIRCKPGTARAGDSSFALGLHPNVWKMLGFEAGDTATTPPGAQGPVETKQLQPESSTQDAWSLVGSGSPRTYIDPANIAPGLKVLVGNTDGEWYIQKNMPAEAKRWLNNTASPDDDIVPEGFVRIGDRLFAAKYYPDADRPYFFITQQFNSIGNYAITSVGNNSLQGTMDELSRPPRIEQVIVERGLAGDILAKLLVSTGVVGYNDEDLDEYPDHIGLGLPTELLDVNSVRNLQVPYELRLEKPLRFKQLLEEVLQVFNKYVVQEDGKLKLTRPGFEVKTPRSFTSLTESNKARPGDRPGASYGAEGIVNHVVLRYSGIEANDYRATREVAGWTEVIRTENRIDLHDRTSQTDHDAIKTLEITARGVLDPDVWAEAVANPILRYWSRPLATITRTINATLITLKPGSIVKLTDDFIRDPDDGTRGISQKSCWVRSVSFDWKTLSGQCELVYMPELDVNQIKSLSPSALVDKDYSTGNYDAGYDSTTKTWQLVAREFALSTEDKDVTHFEVGDEIKIIEKSPVAPLLPLKFTDTIASVDTANNRITGTGGANWDNTREYTIEAVKAVDVQSSQRDHCFLADPEEEAIQETYKQDWWSGDTNDLDNYSTDVDYDTEVIRTAEEDYEDGQPFSVRKLMYAVGSLNNLLSYKTRNVLYTMPKFPSGGITESQTTYELVHGPIWIPLYGVSTNETVLRQINGHFHINRLLTADDPVGSIRLTFSRDAIKGSSFTSGSWKYSRSVRVISFAATDWTASQNYSERITIEAMTPIPTTLDGQIGTWLSVEITGDAGNSGANTLYLSELHLVESNVDTSEQIPLGLDELITESGAENIHTESGQTIVTET